MTEKEKEMFELLKEIYDWTNCKNTPWAAKTKAVLEKFDPQPREYRARWPEHKGCLIVHPLNAKLPPMVVRSAVDEGLPLYTGPHKFNMTPNDSRGCPVHRKQLVIVQFRDGEYSADIAGAYRWSHVNNNADIMYYCSVDPMVITPFGEE